VAEAVKPLRSKVVELMSGVGCASDSGRGGEPQLG